MSCNEKLDAEMAAKRVARVAKLANGIEVGLPNMDERPDPEIAPNAVAEDVVTDLRSTH